MNGSFSQLGYGISNDKIQKFKNLTNAVGKRSIQYYLNFFHILNMLYLV